MSVSMSSSEVPEIHVLMFERKTVKKIKKCDADKTWEIIQQEIGQKVFGGECIPVPHIREASRYELNSVILVKYKNILDTLFFRPPQALAVNMLQEMIRSDVSTLDGMQLIRPEKINRRYCPDLVVFGTSGQKTVSVRLIGLSMEQTTTQPMDGDIMLDMTPYFHVYNTDFVYLVTKVIYANEVRVQVGVGNNLNQYIVRNKIPVGFALTKYNVTYNAILGTSEEVLEEPIVRWLKFTTVEIPRTLLVERDNRGGGDDGKRVNGPRNVRHRTVWRNLQE